LFIYYFSTRFIYFSTLGIQFDNKENFWKSFNNQLKRYNPELNFKSISNSDDFVELLKLSHKEKLFQNKKVVIFIDEFDLLYYSKDEFIIDDVLNVLRGIKHTKDKSSLHSFVAIGPFSILNLTGKSASPFNIKHAINSPNFNQDEVILLSKQIKEDYGDIIDERIPIDIFERTSGHRGLTDFCYKCILERMYKDKTINYEDWLNYSSQLIESLPNWSTMQKLKETLLKDEKNIPEARNLLITHFLPSNTPVKIEEAKNNLAQFLTAEGALTQIDNRIFQIPSSLIRNYIIETLISAYPISKIPKESIPFKDNGNQIDIIKLIEIALKYFDRESMFLSQKYSFKKSRSDKYIKRDSNVPQEGNYHMQMYSILLKWIQNPTLIYQISVITEANVPRIIETKENIKSESSRRCDLVIDVDNGSYRYIIELMASDNDTEIKKHLSRIKYYTRAMNGSESWLIHFISSLNFKKEELFWPSNNDNINLIYVFHDLAWKNCKMVVNINNSIEEIDVILNE